MPLNNPKGGFNSANEFQSSGLPWVTSSVAPPAGSPAVINFNYITRFISLSNQGSGSQSLSVGFTLNGMANNYKFILAAGQMNTWELRCKQLFIQGETGTPTYSLMVGLTTIEDEMMPALTGSFPDGTNWAGVG